MTILQGTGMKWNTIKLTFFFLIAMLLFTGCQKICSHIGYSPESTDLTKEREVTQEAISLADEFGIETKTPYICSSSKDCNMWEYCVTLCEVAFGNELKRMQCPMELDGKFGTVISDRGICVDVPCKELCDPKINQMHSGCCITEVTREN